MRSCLLVLLLLCTATAPLTADEIFHIEQCRVLDTRNLGGPIANGTEYSFKVRGQVGGAQGGAALCGAPIEASGVFINVTALPSGVGHLEAYPLGRRPPTVTSRLNYTAGIAVANEILVRLNQPINTLVNEITLRPSVSPVHLVVDLIAWTGEANPTFPMIKGRLFGAPFLVGGMTHVTVETAPGGGCASEETCFEVECSDAPGAGEVCAAAEDSACIEIQGYRRPYSSPRWMEGANRRLVGTIVRLFASPCPWE